jgi:diadenosine tetraphosphate (Ap4A) HIT family hydrolase
MGIERWPNEAEMLAELYGGAWSNLDAWASRCRPDGCIVCTSGRPFGILAEFPHTWVTTDPDVAIFGYVCVISKLHAVEPFDLSDTEGAAFWREAMAIAAALHQELRPIKMNYEIHGNTLPHLHMHIFPRQADDPFVGRPIDTKEMHYHYTPEDLSTLRSALKSALPPPT